MSSKFPEYTDVLDAAERIKAYASRTPVLQSSSLNELLGYQLYFKCENFQKVGAFKFRGGCNAVFSLDETLMKEGVATHSSGNHAQAVALAAKMRGIPATIVMPENAPKVKVEAVRSYGADIRFCPPTIQAREEGLKAVLAEKGGTEIHPYDNFHVIAGQGTAALELIDDFPDLDAILAPVGGGGLLSGTAITARARSSSINIYGCEPEQADDAYQSFKKGHRITDVVPNTIADGLRTTVGELTFPIIQQKVSDILTVSEASIIEAMRLIWMRLKIIIEPSCAVPVAAILLNKLPLPKGQKVGIILTGGNVDLDKLPWMD